MVDLMIQLIKNQFLGKKFISFFESVSDLAQIGYAVQTRSNFQKTLGNLAAVGELQLKMEDLNLWM